MTSLESATAKAYEVRTCAVISVTGQEVLRTRSCKNGFVYTELEPRFWSCTGVDAARLALALIAFLRELEPRALWAAARAVGDDDTESILHLIAESGDEPANKHNSY